MSVTDCVALMLLVIEPAPELGQQPGGSGVPMLPGDLLSPPGALTNSLGSQQNCSCPQMGVKSNKHYTSAVYITLNARLLIASSSGKSFLAPL